MRRYEHEPASEKLRQTAQLLHTRFVQRPDFYARQRPDGCYVCVRRPLTEQQIVEHLQGQRTLGVYVLDADSRTSLLVLDADDDRQWAGLLGLAANIQEQEIPAYCEESRRGGHLWLFLAQPWLSEAVRRFGLGLLRRYDVADVELFPKQGQLDQGPGSLIRLSFGVHRKSGSR